MRGGRSRAVAAAASVAVSGVLVLSGCSGASNASRQAAEPVASPAVSSAAGGGHAARRPAGDDGTSVTGGLSSPAASSAERFDTLRKADEAAKQSDKVIRAAEKAARKAAKAARRAGNKAGTAAQAGAATNGAPAAPPLPRSEAATRYDQISQAYVAGSRDLVQLVNAGDSKRAALRAAVRKAADAYEARIAALQHTAWPRTAQPYVNNYLALATTVGHDLFKRALDAKTLADLRSPGDISATFELDHAEQAMAAHITPAN